MKSNLAQRAITALVAVSVLIPALIFSPLGAWLLAAVVSLLGIWEFWGIHAVREARYRWLALAPAIVFWGLLLGQQLEWGAPGTTYFLMLAVLTLPLLLLVQLFDPKAADPAHRTGTLILGYAYVLIPMYLFYQMSFMSPVGQYNFHIPLGLLFLTWILDVMAYFVGRFLGKHPLFPRISPKKTWEGAIGAVLFCLLMAWGLTHWWPLDGYSWFVIAGIISVISQLGDLVESMFKRQADIKDSGSILPGHGGMLDRFDGMFLSLPFIFCYFLM